MLQQRAFVEDFLWCAFHHKPSFGEDKHAIRAERFFHKLRNHDDGHAVLLIELSYSREHLFTPSGVEHGGCLVQNQNLRLHGEQSRDGDALFLSAGESVAGLLGIGAHLNFCQSRIYPLANLRRCDAEVLGAKADILFYNGGDKLIVRVLKHHADAAADFQKIFFLRGIQPCNGDRAFSGQKQGVEELAQRAFAGAVVPDNGNDLALLNGQADVLEGRFLRAGILKPDVHEFDDGIRGHVLLLIINRRTRLLCFIPHVVRLVKRMCNMLK